MIVYLAIPEVDWPEARRRGVQRDVDTGRWFVRSASAAAKLSKWLPARTTAPTSGAAAKPAVCDAWQDPRATRVGRKGKRQVLGLAPLPPRDQRADPLRSESFVRALEAAKVRV